jgi:hypothetical protein
MRASSICDYKVNNKEKESLQYWRYCDDNCCRCEKKDTCEVYKKNKKVE